MRISVLIATYGEDSWKDLAWSRAYPSARDQDAVEVLVFHDPEGTISSVRNELGRGAKSDWLLFLDGDDELAPGFLDAMRRAYEQERGDGPLLLTPAVSYAVQGRRPRAHIPNVIPLRDGNWLSIGTLIPRVLFQKIGGFREWPLYEDWDLWARSQARVVKVPEAVYLAHYSRTSRNRTVGRKERNYWHQMIGHDLWPDYYDSPSGEEHQAREVAGVRKLALA